MAEICDFPQIRTRKHGFVQPWGAVKNVHFFGSGGAVHLPAGARGARIPPWAGEPSKSMGPTVFFSEKYTTRLVPEGFCFVPVYRSGKALLAPKVFSGPQGPREAFRPWRAFLSSGIKTGTKQDPPGTRCTSPIFCRSLFERLPYCTPRLYQTPRLRLRRKHEPQARRPCGREGALFYVRKGPCRAHFWARMGPSVRKRLFRT